MLSHNPRGAWVSKHPACVIRSEKFAFSHFEIRDMRLFPVWWAEMFPRPKLSRRKVQPFRARKKKICPCMLVIRAAAPQLHFLRSYFSVTCFIIEQPRNTLGNSCRNEGNELALKDWNLSLELARFSPIFSVTVHYNHVPSLCTLILLHIRAGSLKTNRFMRYKCHRAR